MRKTLRAVDAGAITSINETMQSAALLGVTICVAAGDDGSSDAVTDGHAHVDFPLPAPMYWLLAGRPKEVIVRRHYRNGWKDGDGLRADNGGSTGGGVSTQFARPSWQTVNIQSINPGSIEAGCAGCGGGCQRQHGLLDSSGRTRRSGRRHQRCGSPLGQPGCATEC